MVPTESYQHHPQQLMPKLNWGLCLCPGWGMRGVQRNSENRLVGTERRREDEQGQKSLVLQSCEHVFLC